MSHAQRQPKLFTRPWDLIGIDLFGPLPKTRKGNRWVLTVVDAFTRFTTLIPLKESTTEAICEALKERVFHVFGFPRRIHSDRGSQFTSETFAHLCKRLRIRHSMTTPYHPQSNGLTERFHRTLKARLQVFLNSIGKEWDDWLGPIQLSQNQGLLATTKFTPFHLTFGRSPNFLPQDLSNTVQERTEDLQLF